MPEKLKYVTLCLFVTGVIFIVFLQFLSGQNIDRLVNGNQKLLQELRLQNELRRLEADILMVESDVRGLIIRGEDVNKSAIEAKIGNIEQQLQALQPVLSLESTPEQIAALNALVIEKNQNSNNVLTAYEKGGKTAGEAVINSGRGKQ